MYPPLQEEPLHGYLIIEQHHVDKQDFVWAVEASRLDNSVRMVFLINGVEASGKQKWLLELERVRIIAALKRELDL